MNFHDRNDHQPLKLTRLPISPPVHMNYENVPSEFYVVLGHIVLAAESVDGRLLLFAFHAVATSVYECMNVPSEFCVLARL